jgi:hypothetical protein
MALSKKQADTAKMMAGKARAGDPAAVRFFETVKDTPLGAAYMAIYEGKGTDMTGFRRVYLDTPAPNLSAKQISVCVQQALLIKDGNHGAKKFYADQCELAEKGQRNSMQFKAVMEEVMEKQARGISVYSKDGSTPGTVSRIASTSAAADLQDQLILAKRALAMAETARQSALAELDRIQAETATIQAQRAPVAPPNVPVEKDATL